MRIALSTHNALAICSVIPGVRCSTVFVKLTLSYYHYAATLYGLSTILGRTKRFSGITGYTEKATSKCKGNTNNVNSDSPCNVRNQPISTRILLRMCCANVIVTSDWWKTGLHHLSRTIRPQRHSGTTCIVLFPKLIKRKVSIKLYHIKVFEWFYVSIYIYIYHPVTQFTTKTQMS